MGARSIQHYVTPEIDKNVLAIETAGTACAVAVLCVGGRTASSTTLRARSHAEQLVPMAVRTIAGAGLEFEQIDAVAVSAGPGSYTGLRIGVSTAKGFASAYGATLVGVPTLQAYALSIARSCRLYGLAADRIAVALHARQTEVYFATFDVGDARNVPNTIKESCVLEIDEAAELVADLAGAGLVRVGGDAAARIIQSAGGGVQACEALFVPGALSVGRIALERLREGHFDDLRSFEPLYLKDYVAKQGGSIFDRLTT